MYVIDPHFPPAPVWAGGGGNPYIPQCRDPRRDAVSIQGIAGLSPVGTERNEAGINCSFHRAAPRPSVGTTHDTSQYYTLLHTLLHTTHYTGLSHPLALRNGEWRWGGKGIQPSGQLGPVPSSVELRVPSLLDGASVPELLLRVWRDRGRLPTPHPCASPPVVGWPLNDPNPTSGRCTLGVHDA